MRILLILLLVKAIQCQFNFGNFNNLINTTKTLQDIERLGDKVVEKVQDFGEKTTEIKNDVKDAINKFFNSSSIDPNDEETKKFINETIKTMSTGVCATEVPTASLLNNNDETPIPQGNGTDPTLSRIQVCCEGYQRNSHIFRKCDPICSGGCANGICAGPERCLCLPNFVKNLAGDCVTTCARGSCQNGQCDGEGKCKCDDGYEAADAEAQFCVPKCTSSCLNGNCSAPNTCTCLKGYEISSEGQCQPVCSGGCPHGVCSAPNSCECDKGYKNVNGSCTTNCSKGCQNGECVAPEVCKCSGNLKLDITGTQCVGSCEKSCLNGVCSGMNRCTCKHGYFPDNYDKFRCVPKCLPQCINSVCSAPNRCLCYQGYVKDFATPGGFKCIKN